MFDNTNYPWTIDPNLLYNPNFTFPNDEILGIRSDLKSENLMNFEIIQFHRPLNNDCPHQKHLYHNNITITMNSIRFNFMNEWVMRINDYIFNQLLTSISDANPYQRLIN